MRLHSIYQIKLYTQYKPPYRKKIFKISYNLPPLIFFVHLLIIDKSENLNQVL